MKKKSARIFILQIVILIMVFSLGTLSVTYYHTSSKAIVNIGRKMALQMAKKTKEKILNSLKIPAISLKHLSHLISNRKIASNHKNIWKLMWRELKDQEEINSISFINSMGNFIQVIKTPKLTCRYIEQRGLKSIEKLIYRDDQFKITDSQTNIISYHPGDKLMYKKNQELKKVSWSYDSSNISVSYKQAFGIIKIDINLSKISNLLKSQDIGAENLQLIVDDNYNIVAYPDKKHNMKPISELPYKWLVNAYNKSMVFNQEESSSITEGAKYYTFVIPFDHSIMNNWKLVTVVKESPLLIEVKKLAHEAMFLNIIFLAISLLAIFII